ncbi:glutamyl-tRNA(Gln) amidotransferase subunit C, chloroplastic/mitochondrial [Rhodamnia argentea]|uniref:Glutamyl-tRNA(Gln) amidotransferase subunit C, chloroplastic/mitochondrial n=1 Tax=Rhodamnia argentea TaxID=178133 RepID=A0A8B8P7I3_9MYRT|nr:glutamyl-tRNA(Gln) amidotransferase subunit C, chloroplastic/mitochondrial [Rhodamnia argentea]
MAMASRTLLLLKGAIPTNHRRLLFTRNFVAFSNSIPLLHTKLDSVIIRSCSTSKSPSSSSSLEPPDLPRLAETARISLTPQEIEEFTPKIRQVVDWFGQLQDVELQSVEPALRADTDGDQLREDVPETFHNREALISSVPSYEEPFIKVPKVLNKESE